jgi:hypothetical protein
MLAHEVARDPALAAALRWRRPRRPRRPGASDAPPVPLSRMRRLAVYLAAVELMIGNTVIARALGMSRQAVKQTRDDVEDLRSHPLVELLLDRVAAELRRA